MSGEVVAGLPGLVRSRLKSANFGPRYLGVTLADPRITPMLANVRPEKLIEEWYANVKRGKVVKAEGEFATCGKGIWFVGITSGPVACALSQSLIIDEAIESALYVRTEDYLQSERPEGERQYRSKIYSDLLILSGYGTERKTEWAEATLDDILASRFDKGLPTIVTSAMKPPESIAGYLTGEMFFSAAIMDGNRGKD